MTEQFPLKIPADLQPYARGEVHQEPQNILHPLKLVKRMRQYRTAYIRGLLRSDPKLAWQLPDFQLMMGAEIKRESRRVLLPQLFFDWDTLVSDIPVFFSWYEREYGQLRRDYADRVHAGLRPKKKHSYLHTDAIRQVFVETLTDGGRLGELECACLGELRRGHY